MVNLYLIFRPLTRFLCKVIGRMEIIGEENFPKEGGVILASNHQSYIDPIVLGSAAKRSLFYLARDTLFNTRIKNFIMTGVHSIPMKRDTGDIKALKKAIEMLKNGKVITIFPEGTRSKDGSIQKGKEGVALLGVKSKCKILPAKLYGTDRILPKGKKFIKPAKLIVKYGMPIDCSIYNGEGNKKLYSEIAEKVIDDIRSL
jgi:1-acyl-sn-glycerol-3-phosphate acyltransferase